ncbi:Major facilitator superfamily domain-containing protein isoform 1 [Schistosoma japonicum]|uniref:Major facilitator superfamily domain-containing protein isoform 1 n=1 Tax=Schistosoma japonicum TaxID=6182 RepID=A0A4Z2DD42_SCHJA|nr:Major facilitator superfamily domain-containing protein isoform 1 [Schistosoma japonicum]
MSVLKIQTLMLADSCFGSQMFFICRGAAFTTLIRIFTRTFSSLIKISPDPALCVCIFRYLYIIHLIDFNLITEDESSNEEQYLSVEVNQYSYTKAFKVALRDSVGSRCLIVLLLMYKLGEQGSMNMLPLMLFDRGFSLSKVGFWTGVVGQLASIIGSTSGYYIQNKLRSPLTSILCLMIIRACLQSPVTLIAFESVWIRIPNVSFWIGCLFMNGLLFVSGAITTIMFTLMMHCTRSETSKEYQATHYCILSSAELLGKLIFGTIAAYFTDVFGYGVAYLCFLLLSLLPIQYVHRNSINFGFVHKL